MSQRHRDTDVPTLPRQERRAHAHSERHRIHVELQKAAQTVSAGIEPEDVHEPGRAWKPERNHDAEIAKSKEAKRNSTKRHWKTKMWKRRTQVRKAKNQTLQMTRDNPVVAGY